MLVRCHFYIELGPWLLSLCMEDVDRLWPDWCHGHLYAPCRLIFVNVVICRHEAEWNNHIFLALTHWYGLYVEMGPSFMMLICTTTCLNYDNRSINSIYLSMYEIIQYKNLQCFTFRLYLFSMFDAMHHCPKGYFPDCVCSGSAFDFFYIIFMIFMLFLYEIYDMKFNIEIGSSFRHAIFVFEVQSCMLGRHRQFGWKMNSVFIFEIHSTFQGT